VVEMWEVVSVRDVI